MAHPFRSPGVRYGKILGLVILSTVAGCAELDLGPKPDDRVGPAGATATALTDPDLQAVKPEVVGDGASTRPAENMPAATGPSATTRAATPPDSQPAARGAVPSTLTVQEAILVGLENSASLRVSRLNVPISRTAEEQARAAFDPIVTGTLQGGANGGQGLGVGTTNNITGNINVQETLPTGTAINVGYSTSNIFDTDFPTSTNGVTLSVTQQLLRGAGLDVNLATLRQAELGTKISQYELRGVAETLVAGIENAYWDLVYANWNVKILQNSVDVAQAQLNDTMARIRLGSIAESERWAAEAQVATQKQSLIDAKSDLNTKYLTFLQLITRPGQPFWDRNITLDTDLFVPAGSFDPIEKHVDVALNLHPDLNETKLEIQQGDLKVVQTKNGLLPQLDFFVNLGQTGTTSAFGTSLEKLNGPGYDAIAGVSGELEPFNRAAKAVYRQSVLSREQLEQTLANLAQVVELNVRINYGVMMQDRLQIDASVVTLKAQQAAYDTEVAKFRAQRSTSLLVAQAQNNLLQAQLNEKLSQTNFLKSLVALYSSEGSLLYRRGINAPGGEPAPGLAWKK